MTLKERYLHQLFETGVFLKAVNGAWELVGGLFLLSTIHGWFGHYFVSLSDTELLGDRQDAIFHFVNIHLVQLSVSTRSFISFYLLFHSALNAFLAYNLFKERLWVFPISIGLSGIFLVYQLYRFTHTHSLVLLAITGFDVVFAALTWHEYQQQKKIQQHQKTV